MNWLTFLQSPEWNEIIRTIQARKAAIVAELTSVGTTPSIVEVRALQAELSTCFWLEKLPELIMEDGKNE